MQTDDLIRRKDAEKALEALALQVSDSKMRTVAKCVNALHFVPAVDTVPVVRCRECKHYREYARCSMSAVYRNCTLHKGLAMVTPDSFCSYGERRE